MLAQAVALINSVREPADRTLNSARPTIPHLTNKKGGAPDRKTVALAIASH